MHELNCCSVALCMLYYVIKFAEEADILVLLLDNFKNITLIPMVISWFCELLNNIMRDFGKFIYVNRTCLYSNTVVCYHEITVINTRYKESPAYSNDNRWLIYN